MTDKTHSSISSPKPLPLKPADVKQRKCQRKTRRRAQIALKKNLDQLEKGGAVRTSELLRAQTRLSRLSRKLLEAQENERKLVAKEIHDGISGDLAAIKICLEERLHKMKDNPRKGEISLERLISAINDTLQVTRRISAHLRPSILDDLGLISTIDWLCRRFEKHHPQIHLQRRLEIEENDVPEQLKIVIYRILKETLANVAKYSAADQVQISLVKFGNELQLRVKDNGCGLAIERINSETEPMRGNDLSNLRDRAEICGGRLEIASKAGAGTAIHLKLPLN